MTPLDLTLLCIGFACTGLILGFFLGRWSGRLAQLYDLNESPD